MTNVQLERQDQLVLRPVGIALGHLVDPPAARAFTIFNDIALARLKWNTAAPTEGQVQVVVVSLPTDAGSHTRTILHHLWSRATSPAATPRGGR